MEKVSRCAFDRGEDVPGKSGELLRSFWLSPQGLRLGAFLDERVAQGAVIFPSDPYRALRLTPLESVRVVIIGQDPYPTPGHAIGLAFAVARSVAPIPRSLKNIYKELAREYGCGCPQSGDLSAWARQGVLLINAALTVESGQAGAHAGKGWECFTDWLIREVAAGGQPAAFLLWGAAAQKKSPLIEAAGGGRHLILKANHPSPLSASRPPLPFIGCGHFRRVNEWLEAQGKEPIDWFDVPPALGAESLF